MDDMNMNNEPPVYDSGDMKPTNPIPTEGENDVGLTEELPMYEDTPTGDRGGRKKIIAIAAGVVLIAGLGIGAFALSSHKTAKLKKYPDDVRPYAIELALYTGMRVGELSGLMWEDIDETRQCINIQHSEKYNALKKTFFVSTPKNGKTRVFPLTAEIAALLKNVREVESKYGYLTEFVFSGPNGRIHKMDISRYMIARTSGDGFTNPKSIHTARRTLNSELIASGAPRAMCCALIGNTELVNETFYTYDVSTKDYKLEMVSKINQRTINNNDNTDVEKLSSNQE